MPLIGFHFRREASGWMQAEETPGFLQLRGIAGYADGSQLSALGGHPDPVPARTRRVSKRQVRTLQFDRRCEPATRMRTGGALGRAPPGEARYAAANCGAS